MDGLEDALFRPGGYDDFVDGVGHTLGALEVGGDLGAECEGACRACVFNVGRFDGLDRGAHRFRGGQEVRLAHVQPEHRYTLCTHLGDGVKDPCRRGGFNKVDIYIEIDIDRNRQIEIDR